MKRSIEGEGIVVKTAKKIHSLERKIERQKTKLGGINLIEIEASDFAEAHEQLGIYMKKPIHRILDEKIEGMSASELKEAVWFTRRCKDALFLKLADPNINPSIKTAINEYFDSLAAWSRGAELNNYAQTKYKRKLKDKISGEDLAWLLQNDNVGCQTCLIFDGFKIIALHTEEDVAEKNTLGVKTRYIEKPNIISMKIQGEEPITFLAYPHLLLGAAAGWTKNFAQFVDALFLKKPQKAGSLANAAAWVTLRLNNSIDPENVIRALMPLADGYAFNFARVSNGKISGKRIEAIQFGIFTTELPLERNSIIYQNCLVSPEANPVLDDYQDIKKSDRQDLEKRRERAERIVKFVKSNHPTSRKPIDIQHLLRVLSSITGGDDANANPDVMFHTCFTIDASGVIAYVGAGAGLRRELIIPLKKRAKLTLSAGTIVLLN